MGAYSLVIKPIEWYPRGVSSNASTLKFLCFLKIKPVVELGHKRVTVNATGFQFASQSRKWNGTKYTISPEFAGKWGAEWLNTRFS